MEISEELLATLASPLSKQPLSRVDAKVVAELNQKIVAAVVRTVQGEPVIDPVETILYCQGEGRYYLVRDGIPVLLADQAILVADVE